MGRFGLRIISSRISIVHSSGAPTIEMVAAVLCLFGFIWTIISLTFVWRSRHVERRLDDTLWILIFISMAVLFVSAGLIYSWIISVPKYADLEYFLCALATFFLISLLYLILSFRPGRPTKIFLYLCAGFAILYSAAFLIGLTFLCFIERPSEAISTYLLWPIGYFTTFSPFLLFVAAALNTLARSSAPRIYRGLLLLSIILPFNLFFLPTAISGAFILIIGQSTLFWSFMSQRNNDPLRLTAL